MTYELGDKCSKLLAGKLKERSSTTYIPYIKGRDGQLIALPKDIAKMFGEFYSSLYNLTPPSTSPSVLEEYLSSSCLARLPSLIRSSLEAPITMEELTTVIKTVKSGKAPGPDGFTLQYYKNYFSVLGAHMIKMFNALGQTTTLPPDALLVYISVIPKEGKDLSECGSYRPISLLYVDLKLFTKLLASHIQPQLTQLIHLDQVGFIPSRKSKR